MRIRLGWVVDFGKIVEKDEEIVINLYWFIKVDGKGFDDIISFIKKGFPKKTRVLFAYDILYSEIRGYAHSGGMISVHENEVLLNMMAAFAKSFKHSGFYVVKRLGQEGHDALSVEKVFEWKNLLYSRYGIVELRAVYTWLNQDGMSQAVKKIEKMSCDEEAMYAAARNNGNWLSPADHEFNIRRLMTNAGLYYKNDLAIELGNWAERYVEALKDSDVYFVCPNAYPNFFIVDSLLGEAVRCTPYAKFPAPQMFFNSIAEKRVLFLTPFSDQINSLYKEGNISNLYTDLVVPEFYIKAIPGFLTTYPNRPHSGWTDTFERLCERVDKEMDGNGFDIFFASCGCYGLPLCHYVKNRYKIPAVYHGNLLNTYLGVSMKSNVDFMKGRKNEDVWKKSYLSGVEGVKEIDGGRYT